MIEACFDSIEKKLLQKVASANKRIYVAVAWFTNQSLFDALINVLKKGVVVKVIVLDDLLNRNEFGLDFGLLSSCGAIVRMSKSNEGTMHNKFCIIDDQVITGSYNWTYRANKNNENIIVVDEQVVLSKYVQEFESIYRKSVEVAMPYQHIKWEDVKEGDFTELRRGLYREIIAKNDMDTEIRKSKLVKLNFAYKSGDIKEIIEASLMPSNEMFLTLEDVLVSQPLKYEQCLWYSETVKNRSEKNLLELRIQKWIFLPNSQVLDDNTSKIQGILIPYGLKDYPCEGIDISITNKAYIQSLKKYVGTNINYDAYKYIPEKVLCINKAKMFPYMFSMPMFDKKKSRFLSNGNLRLRYGLYVFGIVKDVDRDNIVFYDGWDPQKRGEAIKQKHFTL